MTSTLFADAYTAYLDLIRVAVQGKSVIVLDGPQPQMPTGKSYIAVGCADVSIPPGADVPAIDSGDQQYVALGGGPRDETFYIWAVILTWTGRNDLAGCRTKAFDLLNAVDGAIRQQPQGTGDAMLNNTLNQGGASVGWCGLVVTKMDQFNDSTGCGVKLQTRLDCFARV